MQQQKPAAETKVSPKRDYRFLLQLTLVGVTVLLWVALAIATPTFFTERNIANLMRQSATIGVIAIGQTFVIISAGIDLSVGSVVALSSVTVATLMANEYSIATAVILTLLLGLLVGLINGTAVHKLGIPPFVATLAMLSIARGAALLFAGGRTIGGLPSGFRDFARGTALGIPNLVWVLLVVAVIAAVLLHRSRWGRYLYAIGSNREAARLSGVNIGLNTVLAYVFCGFCAALAGIILTSRTSVGQPTAGVMYELESIAAAVIGGASLFGAEGTILGAFIGNLLLSTIANGANLLGIDPFWQQVITGVLIGSIVYIDQLRKRRQA